MLVVSLLASWPTRSHAAPIYWDGTGGTANDWAGLANWSSDIAGGTNVLTLPGTADIATFNATSLTAAATINLNAARSVSGLAFTSAGTVTLLGGGTNRTLTLGADGMLKTGAGAVAVGSGTANQNVAIALGADQTWSNNNNTGTLSVINGVSSPIAGPRKLSLGGTSTAANVVSGVIANGTGTVSVGKVGAGTWNLSAANTFTGGVTLSGGILQLNNGSAAGTGTIALEDGNTGRLLLAGGQTYMNNITSGINQAGVAGLGTISQTGTGRAILFGSVSLSGTSGAGGILAGGGVGNELLLNGPLISLVPGTGGTQRVGRVIYRGGGDLSGTFGIGGRAIMGKDNGLPTGLNIVLALTAPAEIELAGFKQQINNLQIGNTTTNVGQVLFGGGTLQLDGNITSVTPTTGNATHLFQGPGTLLVGGVQRDVTVTDTLAGEDMNFRDVTVSGAGGLRKRGAGTLAMQGNVTGAFLLSEGALAPGGLQSPGVLQTGSFSSEAGTRIILNSGPTPADGDRIRTGQVSTSGATQVFVNQSAGLLEPGVYPFLEYTGTSPGVGMWTLGSLGHAVGSIVDTGTALAVSITENAPIVWDGTATPDWNASAINWLLPPTLTATAFVDGDVVQFKDGGSPTVNIPVNVQPARVEFSHTSGTYQFSGAAGISGFANVVKTGAGRVVLANPNSYSGVTRVLEGELELDHDATSNAVLTASQEVAVSAGTFLRLTRDDGDITFTRPVSGAGTVLVDPHSVAGAGSRSVAINGANAGFTGKWELRSSVADSTGTFRWSSATAAQLGGGSVLVHDGAQLWTAGTTNTNVKLIGIGYNEPAGGTPVGLGDATSGVYLGAGTGALWSYAGIGALRMNAGDVFNGNVTLAGNAKITAFNGTGTITGSISSEQPSDVLFVGGGTSASTLEVTGDVQVGTLFVNTGAAATNTQHQLRVGANTAGGSIVGVNEVILYASPRADLAVSALLQYSRTGGAVIPATQKIVGAAAATADLGRIRVLSNTTGTGVVVNGSIDISDGTNGGLLDVASNVSGSSMHFGDTAVVDTGLLTLGQAANMNGLVTQAAGSSVTVLSQLRVGLGATETSTYTMNGGTLSLSGANVANTPSTGVAGAANTVGDTNLLGVATPAFVGGGIYLGLDGTGVFEHNGGTVSTNWIVLDNRTDTLGGANMPEGVDIYKLGAGTLSLRSSHGILQRGASSSLVFTGGGRVEIDNSGTGPLTGANLTVPLASTIETSGTTTLDTMAAGNSFMLTQDVSGTGTLDLAGGGKLSLSPSGALQTVTAKLTGTGILEKTGAGTTLLQASTLPFTGQVQVNAGRLVMPSIATPATLSLGDGATLAGEPQVTAATLGAATGGTVVFDPNTAGALTVGNLVTNGVTKLEFAATPAAAGPWTALNYTSKNGSGIFELANAADYRSATVTDTGSSVLVNYTGLGLRWTGVGTDVWDLKTSSVWNDGANQQQFFQGDKVLFDDTAGVATSVTVSAGPAALLPGHIDVNSSTNNFTLNGLIGGPTGLTKSGTSILTLTGANTFYGPVVIDGGTVVLAAGNNIGDGSTTNKLSINGGTVESTATLSLGTRAIAVGTAGATFTGRNAAAHTVTLAGPITGSGPLVFDSLAAGSPAFVLSGDNVGYTGEITVRSNGPAPTTLRLLTQASVPNATCINLINPTTGATGASTSLDIQGHVLPAATTVKVNSLLSGTISLRSGVISGQPGGEINGPILAGGNSIVQFNTNVADGLSLNGNISAQPAGFTGVFFIRGGGTGEVNGVINLPNAIVSKTDAGTWTINSTGHTFPAFQVLNGGSVKIGVDNALPTTATLTIGQADALNSLFDLNGFDQTVGGLIYVNGNGSSTRGVGNTAAELSVFTVNQAVDATFGSAAAITGGTLSGNLDFVKQGAGNLTLNGSGTFIGDVTIKAGILTAAGRVNSTVLGAPNVAGRSINVEAGTELRLTAQTVFGTAVGNTNLPVVNVTGAKLAASRYNPVGELNLNGATVEQTSTDTGNFEGLYFRGPVNVSGSAPSVISAPGGAANHLGAATRFTVADATASAAADLTIDGPLRDGSLDFGFLAGSLVKAGPGTLLLASGNHTYSGATMVEQGVLRVDATLAQSPVTVATGGTLQGNGNVGAATVVQSGGRLEPGASVGTLNFAAPLSLETGSTWQVEITGATVVDRVVSTSTISAGGTIAVVLNGYVPVQGDTFDVADATAISGTPTFDFTAAPLTAGLVWDTTQFASQGVVRVINPTADPYTAWATEKGVTGGKFADDDLDGSPNLLEYATDSEPKNASSLPRAIGRVHPLAEGSVLTFTVAVRKSAEFAADGAKQKATKDGVVYRIEASNDLAVWNTVVVTPLSPADQTAVQAALTLGTLGTDYEWRTFRTDGTVVLDDRDMIRLAVEAPQP